MLHRKTSGWRYAADTTMLRTPLMKKAPKIHDAMSDSLSRPAAPTERMIATGPVHAKRNATTALPNWTPPRSRIHRRGPGTGNTGRSSVMFFVFATLESSGGASLPHRKVFHV